MNTLMSSEKGEVAATPSAGQSACWELGLARGASGRNAPGSR